MQRIPDPSGGDKKTKVTIDKPKSECSTRDVPINKNLLEVLRRFYKPGAFLLTGDKDKFVEPKTMENRFKSILKKTSLNFSQKEKYTVFLRKKLCLTNRRNTGSIFIRLPLYRYLRS